MSQAAAMIAARNQLQTTFSLDADSCEVGFDGRPKPAAGEFYIAVHPLSWSFPSGDWDLSEEYQVAVTLTLRMGAIPQDRWGIAVWLAQPDGLETRVRQAITAIHHNQAVRAAANAQITGGASGKLMTPLQVVRVDPPKLQGPTWFEATPESDGGVPKCGVSQTIIFGKCQRVQSIPDMD